MSEQKHIYLDYAASTPVDKEIVRAMEPYFGEKYGNPSSLHSFGQEALAAIDHARETIAKGIGAEFQEVVFTGSATEANNLALRGVVKAARLFPRGTGRRVAPAATRGLDSRRARSSGDQAERASETFRSKTTEPLRIVVSSIEHESVLETARDLEKDGIEMVYVPVNKDGIVEIKKIEEALDERTSLVSVMHASNEIGAIQPISEISEVIGNFRKELGIRNRESGGIRSSFITHNSLFPLFHTDAAQTLHLLDCDVRRLGVDIMTLSSQKMYGPKGIGALYIPGGIQKYVSPIITGGNHEYGFRAGTPNVPASVGFGVAAERAIAGRKRERENLRALKTYFLEGLRKLVPNVKVNGADDERSLPSILNVYFQKRRADELLIKFDEAGIAAASGSACSARAAKPSHVLSALGYSKDRIIGSVRFSFGRPTTQSELLEALKRMEKIFR